ncbi:MAG: hypothetical protein LC804_13280, partial [Acidobacteria bacterium]|nr:hypothetical protein [Acidobacteriota bacterium]
ADVRQVVDWFELGGTLQIDDTSPAADLIERTGQVQGLRELAARAGAEQDAPAPILAGSIDFVLEGLYAQKKISRSEEWKYQAAEPTRRAPRTMPGDAPIERDTTSPAKKKYYN